MLTYGSICTGIASECVAWSSLNWLAKWFSEIDPFCCSFLKEKYPNVKNIGDMWSANIGELEKVDVIVGGTPCQSFSINSRGKGLDDRRGQLSLRFIQIINVLRPRWVLWENVPNALSVESGNAFRCITTALARCGYGWAYRVLDLQGFGIPQRRRRLFLVGFLGGIKPAAAVLLDTKSNEKFGDPVEEVSEKDLARTRVLDGWTGDSTPKRSKKSIPTIRRDQGGEGIGWVEGKGKFRKLTITEMESLQGFPKDYTKCFHNGKLASDSVRRKAIGNSFSPPILYWIGSRISFVDDLITR